MSKFVIDFARHPGIQHSGEIIHNHEILPSHNLPVIHVDEEIYHALLRFLFHRIFASDLVTLHFIGIVTDMPSRQYKMFTGVRFLFFLALSLLSSFRLVGGGGHLFFQY